MKNGLWIVIILLLVSVTVNVFLWHREPDVVTVSKRDTIWKDTAIHQPSPVDSNKIGRIVYIKVPITKRDTLMDTIRDSIPAPVPIMQKRYEDSLYTAWVSGFQPNLDSIKLYHPEVTNTVIKYVERHMQRLNIGASVGAGYGIINQKPDIFIGITLTWNFGKRKK